MLFARKALTGDTLIRREWAAPFGLFLLLILFEAMDSNAFGPIIAQIKEEFDLTATQVGLYSGLGSLFGLLVTVPVGELMRRKGYRIAGTTTSGLIFVGALVSFVSPTFLVAIFGRIIAMCGTRGCLLVGQAGGIMVAPKRIRNTAWSVLTSMISIGGGLGALVLGGYIGGNYGWRAVMLVIAVSAVVLALVYAFFLRMHKPSETDAEPGEALGDDAPTVDVYKIWQLYFLGLAFALCTAGMTVNTTFASIVVKDSWNLTAHFTGTAIGLGQFISLPFTILSGILADRYLPRRLVITLFVLVTVLGAFVQVASLSFGAAHGGPAMFMTGLILCFIGKAGGGLLYACVPDFVKSHRSLGPAYAVLSLVSMSGYVVEPILAGFLRDVTGSWHVVFTIFGIAPLVGLFVVWLMKVR